MARVLMVVSSVGYHWEEVFAGYWGFVDAGCEVVLHTVDGAPARPDPMSLKRTGPGALFGLGVPADIAPGTVRGRALLQALESVRPVVEVDADAVDTIYLPGGHGCLFDVNRNARVHGIVRRLHERGCILSGVCHATSTFAFVESGGRSIVAGHGLTGFPHPLDRTLIRLGLVRSEFLPLPLVNDAELRRGGADLRPVHVARAFVDPRYTRVSLPFITGVGPKAAGKVARAVVRAVTDKPAHEGARRTTGSPASTLPTRA